MRKNEAEREVVREEDHMQRFLLGFLHSLSLCNYYVYVLCNQEGADGKQRLDSAADNILSCVAESL